MAINISHQNKLMTVHCQILYNICQKFQFKQTKKGNNISHNYQILNDNILDTHFPIQIIKLES